MPSPRSLSSPLKAMQILDEQFLAVRAKLIDVAATLDRFDRAAGAGGGGSVDGDPRIGQIHRAVKRLLEPGPGRAEQIQMLFSLPCDDKTA